MPNTSKPYQIAIITSQFNQEITDKLYHGALAHLKSVGLTDAQILSVWVPGAIELPVTAQLIATQNLSPVIICLGAVIRGETSHYDYVCQQVSYGCQQVALNHCIPVIFGVLTTEDEVQALERAGGKHGNKGADAALAALQMAELAAKLHTLTSQ